MSQPIDGMPYYMPLTKGLPKDGPTTSVFSVPKVNYSRETESVVKNLMRESRLTFTQKHVFDTILRNGKCLPEHPQQMVNRPGQTFMQQRHRNKARLMGVPLIDPDDYSNSFGTFWRNVGRAHTIQTKRSLDTITASGDLEPATPPKCYIPVNKPSEKDRLAHKMAYGKDPIDLNACKLESSKRKVIPPPRQKSIDDLKQERFEELIDEIQDRMQFLLTMEQVKKGNGYRPGIINEINEKLREMRGIDPKKEKDVRECLELEELDTRLRPSFAYEHRTSKFFE